MTTYKRYQYIEIGGVRWTKWFKLLFSKDKPKYQYGRKLLNEYKEVDD